MGYYRGAGDYYRGGGDLGFGRALSVLKRISPIARRVPGVGTAVGIAGGIAALAPRPQIPTRVHPEAIAPGGRPFLTRRKILYADSGEAPKGYHLNKSDGKYGARGTYYVRNRRMNPLNARALRRGISRFYGAERILRKVLRIQGKKTGRVVPRTTRRKRA